jgi:hypothetical protein
LKRSFLMILKDGTDARLYTATGHENFLCFVVLDWDSDQRVVYFSDSLKKVRDTGWAPREGWASTMDGKFIEEDDDRLLGELLEKIPNLYVS